MRILILGGGQIARAVHAKSPAHHEVQMRTHAELDIVNKQAVSKTFSDVKADWIVNAAAFTEVDLAEEQKDKAFAVNDSAVETVALTAHKLGSRLIQLSTDFVFDGLSSRAYLTTDSCAPLSVYGASKLSGERHALRDGHGIVLRTSWVYAAAGKNFVLTMLRLMKKESQIRVVADQIGSPTWANSVATAIWRLIEVGSPSGLYHWSDLGEASWYDFAVAIQEEAIVRGLISREIPILPIASSDYPARAKRPAFSVLDTASTRSVIGLKGEHWRQNLRKMLDGLPAT